MKISNFQDFWAAIREKRPELHHLANDGQFGFMLGEVVEAERNRERERFREVARGHVRCGDYYHDEGRCPEAILAEIDDPQAGGP